MRGKSPLKIAVGLTAFALLAAGCGGASNETGAATNTIVIGIGEPQHLLPANATESNGSTVLAALFHPLVDFDAKNEPYEVAAESITTRDNKVWTIKLKDGYTFHNGEKVTADNYIDAWNYGAYGPNAQGGSYFFERIAGYGDLQSADPDGEDGPKKAPAPKAKTLSGLKKVDDLTFTVTLAAPFSGFKSVLGYSVFNPLPKAAFSAPGVIAEGFEEAIVGQGPYKMKGTWQHDAQVQVERYAAFPGEKPKVDGVTFKIFQGDGAQGAIYNDLLAGNVDVQTKIPIENLGTAPQDLGERLKKSPNSAFRFLVAPASQKEFAKPEVRKAISMAFNRQEISDKILLGSEAPATAFVSPVVTGFRANACGEACTFDPVKAKQLYTAAGGPKEIKITYNADGGHKAWVDATCNQITASLGVACIGVGEPKFPDLLNKIQSGAPVGLVGMTWTMDYPLMESYLGPLYTTDGYANDSRYSNPAFDRLVAEGSAAATPAAAIEKWQQAEDILARDLPVVPLRFGQNVFGHSSKVANVEVDPRQQVDLFKIEVVG